MWMDNASDNDAAMRCGENGEFDAPANAPEISAMDAGSQSREFDAASSSSLSSSPTTSTENFSAREVAAVARCLCASLVSIRAGKIVSHGHILRPTDSRGHLELTMLPSSELSLSFLGDEGTIERLVCLSEASPAVVLQWISTDTSGRSFVIKLPSDRSVFFWQSEKSKARGDELVRKMKDILHRRPTLCNLTGIGESRLKSIATCLQSLLPSPPPTSSATPPPTSPLADSIRCSSDEANDQTPNAVCSQTLAAIGMSLGLAASSPALPGPSSIAASIFSLGGARLLPSSGEVDKKAFAQRILASLPQTFVPFPLLVSGSISVPSVPLSAATSFVTPYYCPCPLGATSALQYSSFAPPHLPALVSSAAAAAAASVGPPPPLVPPLSFSLPSSVSGPIVGVVMPESPVDILGVYTSLCFPSSVELGRNFGSGGGGGSGGVISSNSLSRIISFSPDRASTNSNGLLSQSSGNEISSPSLSLEDQAAKNNTTGTKEKN